MVIGDTVMTGPLMNSPGKAEAQSSRKYRRLTDTKLSFLVRTNFYVSLSTTIRGKDDNYGNHNVSLGEDAQELIKLLVACLSRKNVCKNCIQITNVLEINLYR